MDIICIPTANAEELRRLPGIGPVRAERIIEARRTHLLTVPELVSLTQVSRYTWEEWLYTGIISLEVPAHLHHEDDKPGSSQPGMRPVNFMAQSHGAPSQPQGTTGSVTSLKKPKASPASSSSSRRHGASPSSIANLTSEQVVKQMALVQEALRETQEQIRHVLAQPSRSRSGSSRSSVASSRLSKALAKLASPKSELKKCEEFIDLTYQRIQRELLNSSEEGATGPTPPPRGPEDPEDVNLAMADLHLPRKAENTGFEDILRQLPGDRIYRPISTQADRTTMDADRTTMDADRTTTDRIPLYGPTVPSERPAVHTTYAKAEVDNVVVNKTNKANNVKNVGSVTYPKVPFHIEHCVDDVPVMHFVDARSTAHVAADLPIACSVDVDNFAVGGVLDWEVSPPNGCSSKDFTVPVKQEQDSAALPPRPSGGGGHLRSSTRLPQVSPCSVGPNPQKNTPTSGMRLVDIKPNVTDGSRRLTDFTRFYKLCYDDASSLKDLQQAVPRSGKEEPSRGASVISTSVLPDRDPSCITSSVLPRTATVTKVSTAAVKNRRKSIQFQDQPVTDGGTVHLGSYQRQRRFLVPASTAPTEVASVAHALSDTTVPGKPSGAPGRAPVKLGPSVAPSNVHLGLRTARVGFTPITRVTQSSVVPPQSSRAVASADPSRPTGPMLNPRATAVNPATSAAPPLVATYPTTPTGRPVSDRPTTVASVNEPSQSNVPVHMSGGGGQSIPNPPPPSVTSHYQYPPPFTPMAPPTGFWPVHSTVMHSVPPRLPSRPFGPTPQVDPLTGYGTDVGGFPFYNLPPPPCYPVATQFGMPMAASAPPVNNQKPTSAGRVSSASESRSRIASDASVRERSSRSRLSPRRDVSRRKHSSQLRDRRDSSSSSQHESPGRRRHKMTPAISSSSSLSESGSVPRARMSRSRNVSQSNVSSNPRRRHSPAPKLPQFRGTVGEWDNFEYQFTNIADLYGWDHEQRLQHLKTCLLDKAVSFVRTLSSRTTRSYKRLIRRLRERFQGSERPEILRKDLYDVKQRVDETIDEFADRVMSVVAIAFRGAETAFRDMMGTETFLRGARDRNAVYETSKTHPTTVQDALASVKSASALMRSVLGKSHSSSRQVTFQDDAVHVFHASNQVTPPSRLSPVRPPRVHVSDASVQCSPLTGSPMPNRSPGQSPRRPLHNRCFHCDQPGHFRSECPLKKSSPKGPGRQ